MPQTLSVLMPFYNERQTLPEIVTRVLASDPCVDIELVMVDDYSSDGSGNIAARLAKADARIRLIRHDKNRGKGAAVRTAIEAATGTVAVIQDADLEYDPADYKALIAPIIAGEADAVFGSRFLLGNPPSAMRSTIFANKVLTAYANFYYGIKLTDMETCLKAVRIDLLKSLSLRSDRFGIEPEITARLAQRKAKIIEVPVSYNPRTYAEGKKIKWTDGVAALIHITKFGFTR